MSKRALAQEARAILVTVLLLALGVAAIWFAKSVLAVDTDAALVSLLVVPIVIYLILSGRLRELRTPGGLEAKFADAAQTSVEATAETIEASMDRMQAVVKGGLAELQGTLQHVDESKPMVLTFRLGQAGYYDKEVALSYVKQLSGFRSFRFAVVLDQDDRFVAYMPAWVLRQILETGEMGYRFVQDLNNGRVKDIRRYPGVITRAISTKATTIQALKEMASQNLEALVVIDEDLRPQGVVEREQVLSELMLAMAKE